jgi:hypothetical protein
LGDDSSILRIESQTFADESFRVADASGLVVLGQLPNWTELRWHVELGQRCGAELKWRRVRSRWADLSADLRRAVLRDLREALITVIDPSIYRFDLEEAIASRVRVPKELWAPSLQAFVDTQVEKYERRRILWASPAVLIQDYLEDDGDMLGGVGGIDGNTAEDRTIISELDFKLKSAESVRFFGARSAAAFSYLLNRDGWDSVLADARAEGRFLTREYVTGLVLARGERTLHTFDEGNRPSLSAIVDLKSAVRARLVGAGRIIVPDGTPVGAAERPSPHSSTVQAQVGRSQCSSREDRARAVRPRHSSRSILEASVRVLRDARQIIQARPNRRK